LFEDYPKYQKRYDTHDSQVGFKIITPYKEENGVVSMEVWSRSKMGAMCSDREALFRVEVKKIGENKW